MRGRSLEIGWRDEDTSDALKTVYLAERDGIIRTRLHALWLLRSGWTLGAVASAVGTHYRSVQRWIAWYRQGGVAAVRARRRGGIGRPARLSTAAQEELSDEVATGRFRTAMEVRDWIATRYQVRYTLAGVYSLLERLRCAPKVPRPRSPVTPDTSPRSARAAGERWA
jgi:transposase